MKYLLLVFLLASFAHATDSKIWSRIDQLNAELKKKTKPFSHDDFEKALSEASQIAGSSELDEDYQKIRSDAFATDFSRATAYTKRAAPAFSFEYGGDYDVHQVSFKYFTSLASPHSAESRFLKIYKSYSEQLAVIRPDWSGGAALMGEKTFLKHSGRDKASLRGLPISEVITHGSKGPEVLKKAAMIMPFTPASKSAPAMVVTKSPVNKMMVVTHSSTVLASMKTR